MLPTLFGGLVTGLIYRTVEKAVGGRVLYLHPSGQSSGSGVGLYLHKSRHYVKVEAIRGKGLQLTLNRCSKLVGVHGDGLYLK